jgi:uncharacterized protein (DUF2141 family)
MDGLGRLSLWLLAPWLFMASMAVAAVWLVEPAKADGLAATANRTASLTIRVERVSAKGGILRLGLYDVRQYPDDDSTPVATADVPARTGLTIVTLTGLPPGRYAIESFQDINGNGKMDTTWLGLPLEPYGFSRDAKPFLSKPGFNFVAFTLMPGENSQTLHLQNSSDMVGNGS